MHLESLLFPGLPMDVLGWRITPEGTGFIAASLAASACCPCCGARSARIHSRYCRTLADVPAHGRTVCLELHLRRFFCDLPGCPQGTFAERLPELAPVHARKTGRLIEALRQTAFATGGEAGARLATRLGMPSSGDTLLRLMRRAEASVPPDTLRVLGVDDWAMRRGQVYGTILCNLETHRPADLLPERSADAFAVWLRQHPGIEVISRDRGGDYARGAEMGAPDAVQVADRWHLLHNLTDALQHAVDRRQDLLGEAARQVAAALVPVAPQALASLPEPSDGRALPAPPLPRAEQRKLESRKRRVARYEQVQELRRQGKSLREIGRKLKLSRKTVSRFASCEQFPERATPTTRPVPIDPYLPYLWQRWEEGCDNVPLLCKEIKDQGFTGSVYMVRRQIRRWRRAAGKRSVRGPRPITPPRIVRPSARRIAWLALGHVRQPTEQDQAVMKFLYERWPQLQETAELARLFGELLKARDAGSMEAWVQLALEPGILPEVGRFAAVLQQDWAAVMEAARQPWSQGQTEGQVNRLKLIKRQMYGRAKFDLLRQRVLNADVA